MFHHPSKKGCGGPNDQFGPVKICVYFTTGKVSTSLEHPRAGKSQLQRTVNDMHMLAQVFDNPRVHSNVSYHKTEETRKKHRETGLHIDSVVRVAKRNSCTQLPGPPQDRRKVLSFQHPRNARIRVWVNNGTIGIFCKSGSKEVYFKNQTSKSIEKYFEDPSSFVPDMPTESNAKASTQSSANINYSYRKPLQDVSESNGKISHGVDQNISVRSLSRNILFNLASEKGFFKSIEEAVMTQFKFGHSGPIVNVYTGKGTLMMQGKNMQQVVKGATVKDFHEMMDKVKSICQSKSNSPKIEADEVNSPLAQALKKAEENAAQAFKG